MEVTTFNLTDPLSFGKYKNYLVEEIIKDDPNYLEWCLDNIDWFELGDKANQALEDELGIRALDDWEEDPWYLGL